MSNTVNDSVAGETELEALAVCSTMVGGGGGVYNRRGRARRESQSAKFSLLPAYRVGGGCESRILSSKSDTGHNLYTSE